MSEEHDEQIEKIKRGLAQANAGEFASDEEVEAFFDQWAEPDDND